LFFRLRREGVHWGEFAVESLIRVAGGSAIFIVALIFFFLLREGVPTFWEVSLGNLLSTRWYPTGATIISVPLGLATAIYMREIAPSWLREVLKPLIEVIAGIPSVVLGFLGMVAIAPIVRRWLDLPTGLTAFTGSIMLAYMALPTIISIAEDAIDAVPKTYRDGALALGATQWQTIYRVVLPAAKSGILTAVLLGLGRAIGETMAVMMVTGNAARMPREWEALFRPVRTMTATIAAEMGEVAQGSTHYHVLFAVGLILFLITFAINGIASIIALRGTPRRGGQLMH